MGHDICAIGNMEYVAYIRFQAYDVCSNALYDALDCQALNGGCSGLGSSQEFTAKQLRQGIEWIRRKGNDHYISLHRKPNADDHFLEMMANMGIQVVKGESFTDVGRVVAFLQECLSHLEQTHFETITIRFD